MPRLETYFAFIGVLLAYQLGGIGPDMLLVISRGVAHGRRTAISTALGCVAAGVIQIPLLAFGLASLIASSPVAYDVLRWAGAGYLVYLGIKLMLARQVQEERIAPAAAPALVPWRAFSQGMLTNLTNPATLTFMLAIIPQFAQPSAGSITLQLVVLGVTMKGTGVIVLGSVALASSTASAWLTRRRGFLIWQERFAGAVLVVAATHLLFADAGRSR